MKYPQNRLPSFSVPPLPLVLPVCYPTSLELYCMYNMDKCMPSARSVEIWCSFISCCPPLTSPLDCIYHIAILLQVCAVAANDLGDLCFDNWIEHISTPFHMSVLYDWMARVKSPGAVHYQVRGYAVQHDHHSINYLYLGSG